MLGTPLPIHADVEAQATRRSTDAGGHGWTVLANYGNATVAHLHERHTAVLPEEPGAAPDDFVRGLTIFEHPRPVVMGLLTDYARQPEFQKDLRGFEVVETMDGGAMVAQHRLRILFTNLRYHVRYEHDDAAHRIAWQLADGYEHDLAEMSGFWELHELDHGRTLGIFGTRVSPGGAVPEGMAKSITRRKIPESMERVRAWVNREGGAR